MGIDSRVRSAGESHRGGGPLRGLASVTGIPGGAPLSPEVASMLLEGLRSVLTVTYAPLEGVVGALDTTASEWTLRLDSGSPVSDHCWVMIDVCEVLRLGPDDAEHAATSVPLNPA